MVLCGDDCRPICDHCLYFKPIYDDEDAMDGYGWCERQQKDVDRLSLCNDFHCWRAFPTPEAQRDR
ncbi:MAG: hypothetical protein KatS3mg073_0043 [Meiothermus sp.]|uniref:Uncharacterized protein n=1 Tax=Meiothermus hypogaeus TaxID=884155 RepID=A0ABX9MTC5_9DEIN|nr:hypothetical protein Mhypo_00872 [Meiothermus hypogaeus]GIW35898.1 MAG: hypothetical protein KatS3mg073_0043 [Meiothermus sp.]